MSLGALRGCDGPLGELLGNVDVIEASRENVAAALHSGVFVLPFPGGHYDSYRPTTSDGLIDFDRLEATRWRGCWD